MMELGEKRKGQCIRQAMQTEARASMDDCTWIRYSALGKSFLHSVELRVCGLSESLMFPLKVIGDTFNVQMQASLSDRTRCVLFSQMWSPDVI